MKNHCSAKKNRPIFQFLTVSLLIIFFVNPALARKASQSDNRLRRILKRHPETDINQNGVAYADVEYRLLDEAELPQILRDCARAVQFLRYHAYKYNLDKKRIASFGGSAGAGTSFWLATHDDLFN